MPALRLEIACGTRAEVHVLDDAEVSVGGDETSALILDHPSVEPEHARIAVRRGRVLIIPSPRAARGVRIGAQVVRSPSVLPPGRRAWLGEVSIAAAPAIGVTPIIAPPGVALGLERPARDGLRRFEARLGEDRAELAVAAVPPELASEWLQRVARSADSDAAARVLRHAAPNETQAWALERIADGVRLKAALDVVARGAVLLPIEAATVIVAGVASAVASLHASWGPLGVLDGELVQLGRDGSVRVVRPGPLLDPWRDRQRGLAPERRRGGVPSRVADVWSVGRLARDLGLIREGSIVRRMTAMDPARRPTDLREIAQLVRDEALRAGLDASTRHVGQLVDLVLPPARPLVRYRTPTSGPGGAAGS